MDKEKEINTQIRLSTLEQTIERVLRKFEDVPETLAEIRKDIQQQKQAIEKISKLEPRIRKLENWRTGIVFIGGFVMAIIGIVYTITAHTLNLQIKDISRQVVLEELEKYIVNTKAYDRQK